MLITRDPVLEPGEPLYGLYVGSIVNRNDPKGLGRVRVHIPGITAPEGSAWAWPLGQSGSGGGSINGQKSRQGFFNIPELGAEVAVLFNQGDEDYPYYLTGNWGRDEVPEATEGGNPDIRVMEFGQYAIVIDDRPETRSFAILDKDGDARVEFNGVTKQMLIETPTSITLRATGEIELDALNIVLNGRPVLVSDDPI